MCCDLVNVLWIGKCMQILKPRCVKTRTPSVGLLPGRGPSFLMLRSLLLPFEYAFGQL